MYSSSSLPWLTINEFLVNIGDIREPKEFCVQVINKIHSLIPYDQARVYYVNDLGKVYDEFLLGVDKRWSDMYLGYFSKIDGGRYSIPTRNYSIPVQRKNGRVPFPKLDGGVYNWTNYTCESSEFSNEYIRPQRINHTAGFAFHSADNFTKSVYILDRTSRSGYSQSEIEILGVVQPHLDNLHKNLFVRSQQQNYITNHEIQESLTRREFEIAELLCRGLTPKKISRKLYISLPTIYRHIANMHAKLNVSNRQELLLKLIQ